MALEAGSVFTKLGGLFDRSEFDKYDRAVKDATTESARPIDAHLGATVDERGFQAFFQDVNRAKGQSANAELGASVDDSGFQRFLQRLGLVHNERADATLGAKVNEAGFTDFQRRVDEAKAAAATAELKADVDESGFARFRAKIQEIKDSFSDAQLRLETAEAQGKLDEIEAAIERTKREIESRKEYDLSTTLAEAKLTLLERKAKDTRDAMAEASLANDLPGGGGGSGGTLLADAAGGGANNSSALTQGLGAAASAATSLTGAMVALAPVIVGLAGSLAALTGSLGAAALGLGALGTAAGAALVPVFALGTSVLQKFTETMTVYKAQQQQAMGVTSSSVSVAKQQATAQDAVRTAQEGVVKANEQVVTAERNYQSAVKATQQEIAKAAQTEKDASQAVRDAKQAETDARKAAVQAIYDGAQAEQQAARDVKRAEQDLTDARKNAAQAIQSAKDTVVTALHDEVIAERDVIQARKDAQTAINDAAKAETAAADAMVTANERVTTAREDAARAARDASEAVTNTSLDARDATLGVTDAHLAVRDAQANVASLQASGQTNTLAYQHAQETLQHALLDVDKANERLKESNEKAAEAQNTNNKFVNEGLKAYQPYVDALKAAQVAQTALADATQKSNTLAKAGVEGAASVIDAEYRLEQAKKRTIDAIKAERDLVAQGLSQNRSVQDSEQRLADARKKLVDSTKAYNQLQKDGIANAAGVISADRALEQAQRRLQDATSNYNTLRDEGVKGNPRVIAAAEQVRNAHQGVADAVNRVGVAMANLATAGAGSANKIGNELAKLDPIQRDLLKLFHQISHAMDTMTGGGADAVLRGFMTGIRDLLPLMDQLRPHFTELGKVIGQGFADLGKMFASPEWRDFFAFLVDSSAKLSREFTPILKDILNIFKDIARAAMPDLIRLVKEFVGWLGGIARSAQDRKDLSKDVHGLVGQFESWLHLIKDLGGVLIDFFGSGAHKGQVMVDALDRILKATEKWFNTTAGQKSMQNFFQNSFEILVATVPMVWAIVSALTKATVELMPDFTKLLREATPGIKEFITGFTDLAIQAMPLLITGMKMVGATLIPALGALMDFVAQHKALLYLVGGMVALSLAVEHITKLYDKLFGNLSKIADAFKKIREMAIAANAAQEAGTTANLGERMAASIYNPIAGLPGRMKGALKKFRDFLVGAAVGAGAEAGIAEAEAQGGSGWAARLLTNASAVWGRFKGWLIGASAVAGAEAGVAESEGQAGAGWVAGLIAKAAASWVKFKAWLIGTSAATGAEAGAAEGEAMATGGLLSGAVTGAFGKAAGVLGTILRSGIFRVLAGIGIASWLAQHVFHSENMDPLLVLHPPSAGGNTKGDKATSGQGGQVFAYDPRAKQYRMVDKTQAYWDPVALTWVMAGQDINGQQDVELLGLQKASADGEVTINGFRRKVIDILNTMRDDIGRNKVRASDLVDPHAAEILQGSFDAMNKYGVSSISDLRSRIEFNMKEIAKAFADNSKAAHLAMANNFGAGITALRKAMDDGTISASSGTKEILRIVNQEMSQVKGSFSKYSAEGQAAILHNMGLAVNGIKAAMRDGKISAQTGLSDIATIARQQMTLVKGHITQLSDEARINLANNFRSAMDAVSSEMRRGEISTRDGLAMIRQLMRDELKVYGITGHQADLYMKGNDPLSGKPMNDTPGSPSSGKARGGRAYAGGGMVNRAVKAATGWIGDVGERGRDLVHIMVGRGEAILNHHQQDHVDQALAVTHALGLGDHRNLNELFDMVNTPHYLARGGRPRKFASGGRFDATAYGPPWGGIEGNGVTATGVDLTRAPHELIVAVDPSVVPLHSKLRITPNPFATSKMFSAEDTGGAIKGRRIDFYDWRGRASQDNWGYRTVDVEVTGPGGGRVNLLDGNGMMPAGATIATVQAPAVQGVGPVPQLINAGLSAAARAANYRLAQATPTAPAGSTTSPVGSATSGPAGTGTFDGLPVAKWIIPELQYARSHGWGGSITSGWRDPRAIINSPVHAPQGMSEHQGIQYPHGAVDFGGPYDAAGAANRASFERAAKSYTGPKLIDPIGFRDDGHMSGTGHARGGFLRNMLRAARGKAPQRHGAAHSANAIINRMQGRVGKMKLRIDGMPQWIGVLEQFYQGAADKYDALPTDFVIEPVIDPNTGHVVSPAAIDEGKLGAAVKQLQVMERFRSEIKAAYVLEQKLIRQLIAEIKKLIAKLKAARAAAKEKNRPQYDDQINTYEDELSIRRGDLGEMAGNITDATKDLSTLQDEAGTLHPTAESAVSQLNAGLTNPDTSPIDPGAPDPGTAVPVDNSAPLPDTTTPDTSAAGSTDTSGSGTSADTTAADIAAQAQQMFDTFTQNRMALFGTYGWNFSPTGQAMVNDPSTAAAGMRFYGAIPPGTTYPGAGGGGNNTATGSGGTSQTFINHFDAPPPDPHTWVQGQKHEAQAAF